MLLRVVTAAITVIVALVTALSVPVAQLRTVWTQTTCCCPDPDNCHCPDHKPDHSKVPTLNACHRQSESAVSPEAAAFVEPVLHVVDVMPVVTRNVPPAPRSPHDAPSPSPLDAPS